MRYLRSALWWNEYLSLVIYWNVCDLWSTKVIQAIRMYVKTSLLLLRTKYTPMFIFVQVYACPMRHEFCTQIHFSAFITFIFVYLWTCAESRNYIAQHFVICWCSYRVWRPVPGNSCSCDFFIFSVTRRSRSDSRYSLTHSLSDDTYWRLDWCYSSIWGYWWRWRWRKLSID